MSSKPKTRYEMMCLPKSTNSSVIALKKLSRRIKHEMEAFGETKRLRETYDHVNITLQRCRQCESDHVKFSPKETSIGRKLYQDRLIQQAKVYDYPYSYTMSRDRMRKLYNMDFGKTVAVRDRYVRFDNPEIDYIVEAIGVDKDGIQQITLAKANNVYVDNPGPFIVTFEDLVNVYYLVDVYFDDYDYTPMYCDQCDTYHDAWANNGSEF